MGDEPPCVRQRSDLIAVRPIASKDEMIFSKDLPYFVQPGTVERQAEQDLSVNKSRDFGDFDEDICSSAQRAEISEIGVALPGVGRRQRMWKMVEHDAQIGNECCELQKICDQCAVGIGTFKKKLRPRELLEISYESGFFQASAQVTAPEISVAYPKKEGVRLQAVQVMRKLMVRWIKITNDPDDEIILLRDLQEPIVVREQRATFDSNSAHDT